MPTDIKPMFPAHAGGWQDEQRWRSNVEAGARLCERCEGTGNELFSMYKACTDCRGTGVAGDA